MIKFGLEKGYKVRTLTQEEAKKISESLFKRNEAYFKKMSKAIADGRATVKGKRVD